MSDLNLDSDDEPIGLSAATLAALQEFRDEEKERQEKFDKLYRDSENRFEEKEDATDVTDKNIEDFEEDWNLSQFWYSKETADTLAKEALMAIDVDLEDLNKGQITKKLAIISAPSVYSAILGILKAIKEKSEQNVSARVDTILKSIYLLEFDPRFRYLTISPEYFILYDYSKPLSIPKELKGTIDAVVVDPPFLSDECHTKTALTARYLQSQDTSNNNSKVIVCTGERVSEIILKVYPGTHITDFFPQHSKGLSNEFRCALAVATSVVNHSTVLNLRSDRLKVVAQLKAAQVSQVLSLLLGDLIVLSSRNFIHTLLTNYYTGEQVNNVNEVDFQMLLKTTDNSIAGAIYSYNTSLVIYKTNNDTLPQSVTLPALLFPLNNTGSSSDVNSLNNGNSIIRGPRMVNNSFYLSITRALNTQSSDGQIVSGSILGYLTIVSKATGLLNVVTTSDLEDGSRLSLIKLGVNGTRSTIDKSTLTNLNYTYVTPSLMCITCYNYQFPLAIGTPEYLALVNGTSGAFINYEIPQYGMVSTGYAPVSTFWQIWGVVVFQPHKYVYGPIRTIQKISIISVFSIGAGVCVLTLLLSGWVLRPITRLQAATEQSYGDSHHSRGFWHFFKNLFLGLLKLKRPTKSKPEFREKFTSGNSFSHNYKGRFQEDVPEFRLPEKIVTRKYIRDELTELTETFNEMTIELRKQYKNLEERVQQRTKEIKTAKSLAETANEAKSLFIANITHELRTPLNGILGMAAVAMEENEAQSVRESLKVIFKSGELLLRLLTDLLSFSKSEVDNMKLEIKGFSISEIISQLHAIFDESSKVARINFSIVMNSDWLLKYEVDGDINRILQVVINLVSNSLKFTPSGGFVKVIISAGKNDDSDRNASESSSNKEFSDSSSNSETNEDYYVTSGKTVVSFVVCDSGSGIAPHLQSRVFEPFVQGEIGAKETRSGAGLGLSICRHLATLMDGTIDLKSEVGNGSCFTFRVPMKYSLISSNHDDSDTERSSNQQMSLDYGLSDIKPFIMETNNKSSSTDGKNQFEVPQPPSLKVSSLVSPYIEASVKIEENKESKSVYNNTVNGIPEIISSPHCPMVSSVSVCVDPIKISYSGVYSGSHVNNSSVSNMNSQHSKKTLDPKICDDLHVLIAEDNRVNQEVMVKMLHLEGIKNVDVANDGIEAVSAVEKCRPIDGPSVMNLQSQVTNKNQIFEEDLSSVQSHSSQTIETEKQNPLKDWKTKEFDIIFMDIQMPNMDGIQATKQIRNILGYKGPIIAVSAYTDKSNVDKCLESGVNDFLGKPLRRQQLHSMLEILVQKKLKNYQ